MKKGCTRFAVLVLLFLFSAITLISIPAFALDTNSSAPIFGFLGCDITENTVAGYKIMNSGPSLFWSEKEINYASGNVITLYDQIHSTDSSNNWLYFKGMLDRYPSTKYIWLELCPGQNMSGFKYENLLAIQTKIEELAPGKQIYVSIEPEKEVNNCVNEDPAGFTMLESYKDMLVLEGKAIAGPSFVPLKNNEVTLNCIAGTNGKSSLGLQLSNFFYYKNFSGSTTLDQTTPNNSNGGITNNLSNNSTNNNTDINGNNSYNDSFFTNLNLSNLNNTNNSGNNNTNNEYNDIANNSTVYDNNSEYNSNNNGGLNLNLGLGSNVVNSGNNMNNIDYPKLASEISNYMAVPEAVPDYTFNFILIYSLIGFLIFLNIFVLVFVLRGRNAYTPSSDEIKPSYANYSSKDFERSTDNSKSISNSPTKSKIPVYDNKAPIAKSPVNQKLKSYILENLKSYAYDTIRSALLKEGFKAETVDEVYYDIRIELEDKPKK